MASNRGYCVCGQVNEDTGFMIQCDVCRDWFHGSCVDVKEHESVDIEKYHCPACEEAHGSSVYKERKNWHRHDYTDAEAEGKAIQTGTPVFIHELKQRHFRSADEVIVKLRGQQLTLPYLVQNGFDWPILIESKEGLDLVMPPENFTIYDICDYVGEDVHLDVIDVMKQEGDIKMTMKEWADYFENPDRSRVYNVISLEFSKTRLSELVTPPSIVRKISWVETCWPTNLPEDCPYSRPAVMKYCLMGTKDSYTDFHIDFGGTSVWYHILKGEKIFYLIQPTPANVSLYERWMSSANQSEMFFGDQVDSCYKLILRKGSTLFIPAGWIHAVLTSEDSLVFGGNFLNTFNIPLQLQVYETEQRIKTPHKYRFPWFETTHWFAAELVLQQLREINQGERKAPHYNVAGAKSLITALKVWSQGTEVKGRSHEDIPDGIDAAKLIKGLSREVRIVEKRQAINKMVKEDKKPLRLRKQLHSVTGSSLDKDLEAVIPKHEISKLGDENKVVTSLKLSLKSKLSSQESSTEVISSSNPSQSSIKLCIPKSAVTACPIKGRTRAPRKDLKKNFSKQNSQENKGKKGKPLKLKVSCGKVVSEEKKPIQEVKNTSVYDFVDSEDDALVVDENPRLPPKRPKASTVKRKPPGVTKQNTLKSEPLKLRLSFNGKATSEKPSIGSSFSSSEQDKELSDCTSPGPKNATIDDLLLASAYTGDPDNTRVSLEEELSGGRTSPSTREAIQGMLSMSKSVFTFDSTLNQAGDSVNATINSGETGLTSETGLGSLTDIRATNMSILVNRPLHIDAGKSVMSHNRLIRRKYPDEEDDEEFEESLKNCPEDGDFIYLGFEATDEEGYIFKRRGRRKPDEAWNPKAKLVPNCPKPERPVREGVRKEVVESGIAAAAAKLANLPPQKRSYNKKKLIHPKNKEEHFFNPQPGPSHLSDFSLKRPASAEILSKAKKPKKGFATAKQRLGKILKIHKMLH
ncbi:histone lysine demethylase PHF8-like isoform X2 [Tachypleus tridentatus]|uniref:histone lysine demethylase PHF8-like isoform X2 n=1 Tax=Tachypleus tridentatus TaxID=6853 RepID=UPI003FCF3D80